MSKKRRRTFSADFKLDTVMEGIRGEKSVGQICRERGISDMIYYRWRDQFIERAAEIFEKQPNTIHQEQEERIAELERMVGKLATENEILKKAKSWLNSPGRKSGR